MADKLQTTLTVARERRTNARLEVEAPTGSLNGVSLTLYVRGLCGTRKALLQPPLFISSARSIAFNDPNFLTVEPGESYVQVIIPVAQPNDAGAEFTFKARLVLPDAGVDEPLWDEVKLTPGAHAEIINLTWWVDEP
jgi:hypothetical protein